MVDRTGAQTSCIYDEFVVVRFFRALVVCLFLTGCVASTSVTESRIAAEVQITAVPAPIPTAAESSGGEADVTGSPEPTVPIATPTPTKPPRILLPAVAPYAGFGAWVDVFDWAPDYAPSSGPAVTVADLEDMAAQGVVTIYFQTSRIDDVGSGSVQNPALVAEFLAAAHALDMAVIGWFLPRWEDADDDLARLVAIADFELDGHRFDGVAVDIEGVPAPDQRDDWNERLIALSEQLRAHVGGDRALGAIVLPPTLLEVVNDEYWPDFPWTELAPLYDVWLPMSYWSFRDDDSAFADGYLYNADSTRRLRSNLGDSEALVHAIGGIGATAALVEEGEPLASVDELDDFVRSAVDTDAIGLSIYDWASQDDLGRQTMAEAVAASPLSD